MVAEPLAHVRRAAAEFRSAGATPVAGHSAHVLLGVQDGILHDLGDFIDDYARHPRLRNDLGLLWLVTVDDHGPVRVEAVPLALDYCHTASSTRRSSVDHPPPPGCLRRMISRPSGGRGK
ncbi:CapA family protein [Pseudonocardia bannensis]|uniref:CapA family protein n=1 Tax=Pseudonocardia bannensis TaxID=630973 RepID=UPI001FE5B1DA|nr:CapA family protein [Pseudonocardia bannensis]